MAGATHPNSSAAKSPPSTSKDHRKSRWESNSNPTVKSPSNPKPSPAAVTTTTTAVTTTVNPNHKQQAAKPSPINKTNTKASNAAAAPLSQPLQSGPTNPSSSNKASQSAHSNNNSKVPIAHGPQFPFGDPSQLGPPPPPAYGFHMLDRRTIMLADGSVRSYFALPPDYQDFTPPIRTPVMDMGARFMPFGPGSVPMSPDGFRGERNEAHGRGRQNNQDYWSSLGLDERNGLANEGMLKRKYGEDERDRRDERDDQFARHRQQLLHYSNNGSRPTGFAPGPSDRREFLAGTSSPFGRGGAEMRPAKSMRLSEGNTKRKDIDKKALKAAFLGFVKMINENFNQKRNYLEEGKLNPITCVVCGRSSKDFPDMHGLIMHTYHSDNADLLVDHMGLHKALCVLMGWNYSIPPDDTKAYQLLAPDEALANQGDLIMWPPLVIIHNTSTGKGKDGHMEGLGNRVMDAKLRDIGCRGGKSKALYSKDGHLGVNVVKFASDQSGLKEAFQLAEFFDKENLGRRSWSHVQSKMAGKDDENNPNLVKFNERTRERERILYGYLGTASDLDKIDIETRKKLTVESLREYMMSKLPTA